MSIKTSNTHALFSLLNVCTRGRLDSGHSTCDWVAELDSYFKAETIVEVDEKSKEVLLRAAIEEIKSNTRKLAMNQLAKIWRLRNERGWHMHHINVTPVSEKCGDAADLEWEKVVLRPSLEIVSEFSSRE